MFVLAFLFAFNLAACSSEQKAISAPEIADTPTLAITPPPASTPALMPVTIWRWATRGSSFISFLRKIWWWSLPANCVTTTFLSQRCY